MPSLSQLFHGLSQEQTARFLEACGAISVQYKKRAPVFMQGDIPKYLFIVESGAVVVENVDQNGKRSIVNEFNEVGTVFGEVYLYIERPYDYSCYASTDAVIMMIPKKSLLLQVNPEYAMKSTELNIEDIDGIEPMCLHRIVNNMLVILSSKALYLNQKLLIFSSASIREKLAKFIIQNGNTGICKLNLNREDLSSFLSIPRPSLSRELINMQKEGLITLEKNRIIYDEEVLKCLEF